MADRWDQFEIAYDEVKRVQEAFWQMLTKLRARARVPREDIDAAVRDMESAHRTLLDLGKTLIGAGSESMIWTSTREHP